MTNGGNAQLPEVERERKPLALLGVAIPVGLLVAAGGLFLFAWIAEEVMENNTRRFDAAVRNWVHQYSSPAMTSVAKIVSWLGEYGVAIAFVIALVGFLVLRWHRAAILLTVTLAGAPVVAFSLSDAF